MRLLSITTQNYRTLQDLTLRFSPNYCTISGQNNAGKSCVIRLLSALFGGSDRPPWLSTALDYAEDRTQWVPTSAPINVIYELLVTKEDDPALVSFIEKIASQTITRPSVTLSISYSLTTNSIDDDGNLLASVTIDTKPVDAKAAKEIEKRLEDSNLLFLYNLTNSQDDFYLARGRPRMFYDFVMSVDEKKALDIASKKIEAKLRSLAKQRMQGLSGMLGRLADRYDVELSPPEGFSTRRMPLGINLRDRNVKVPINDWGSGTQNRTYILMALLQAYRIKTTGTQDQKITPFVVIEEPESFLHPSGQAEFGR